VPITFSSSHLFPPIRPTKTSTQSSPRFSSRPVNLPRFAGSGDESDSTLTDYISFSDGTVVKKKKKQHKNKPPEGLLLSRSEEATYRYLRAKLNTKHHVSLNDKSDPNVFIQFLENEVRNKIEPTLVRASNRAVVGVQRAIRKKYADETARLQEKREDYCHLRLFLKIKFSIPDNDFDIWNGKLLHEIHAGPGPEPEFSVDVDDEIRK
jgi:hypothetical protein